VLLPLPPCPMVSFIKIAKANGNSIPILKFFLIKES